VQLTSEGRSARATSRDASTLEASDATGPLAGWAQRRTEGSLEAAGFVGAPGNRVFAFAHVPSRRIRGSVLVCPPLLAETLVTYRGDRQLAGSLAQRGIAVMRFHHRGSGNSEGSPQLYSLDDLVEDALVACQKLSDISGRPADVVIGTRLGATVAAVVARRLRIPRIALIAPVLDPKKYLREVFRGHLISEMKTRTTRLSVGDLERSLDEHGWVDIVGYPIGRELFRSVSNFSVTEALARPIRSVLLVHMGKGPREHAAVDALSRELTDKGMQCSAASLPVSLAWWFGGGGFTRAENEAAATGVIDLVQTWLDGDVLGD
jgi:alpha/beta superfamily hydrolase